MFSSWLFRPFSSALRAAQRPIRTSRRPSRRFRLETLEDRCVPAAPTGTGPLPSVTAGLTTDQVNSADVVIDWNATALRAIWNGATPPPQASRVLAMLGTAVFDAVDAINPVYSLYSMPGLSGKPKDRASEAAAAIAAANTVLNSLYPSQSALFQAEYNFTIGQVPDGKAKTDGIAWGQNVANAVIAWRSTDNVSTTDPTYTPAPAGGTPGVWELTPPAFKPALSPQWGRQTTWALTSGGQFMPPPPPALDSAQYAADLNKTRNFGGSASDPNTPTQRTADETAFALFWSDGPGASATPPGHWNEVAEHMSLANGMSLEDNAHLFGMLNIGMADAAINCWDAKYTYNFWRPVTAINDPRASSINPATSSDPLWTSLITTPNFPSYDSGHSTFSGTADAILTALFGPNTSFTIGSDAVAGTRSFSSFTAAADEAGESRIMGGIHYEFDNQAGLACGRQIGDYISQNFMYVNRVTAALQVDPNDTSHFILFIGGSDGNDAISVVQTGQVLQVFSNKNLIGQFDASLVDQIVMNCHAGNDKVDISPQVTANTFIYGQDGNDMLIGDGSGNMLDGGAGHNILVGGPGDTMLNGKEANHPSGK